MTIEELRAAIDDAWADLKQAQRDKDIPGQRRACAAANRYERQLTALLAAQGHRGALSVTHYRERMGL